MRPVDVARVPSDGLDEAATWVGERGGCGQVAADLLKTTAGDARPVAIRTALEKAGAPRWVFSLVWRDVYCLGTQKS